MGVVGRIKKKYYVGERHYGAYIFGRRTSYIQGGLRVFGILHLFLNINVLLLLGGRVSALADHGRFQNQGPTCRYHHTIGFSTHS